MSAQANGLGVVVAFGGEIHGAMVVRKVDSTGPAAFGSPATGPLGRMVEGRVWLYAEPLRTPPLRPHELSHRVAIVTASLGDDGALLRAAGADTNGLVVVSFGAGHLTPGMLDALREALDTGPGADHRPSRPGADAVRDLRLRGR